MKIFKNSGFAVTVLVAVFTISLSNCSIQTRTGTNRSSYKAKKLPPGQAKKIYGGKSAKRYAPGQNK
ncbi:hypothetical protein ACFX5D_09735 [Flavobacterium sp. LB3P45]|uniref:Quinol oxidase subunit 4 n=1 Tax=Flavobacterium fructosi TaxID=3230416 RepID=A0ABW6HMH5_9FLAO